ncbi:hypothetical protein MUP59_09410, partial [Candidatus Bathyarchaeota archaeon]|nr:hypothetical protein [Candidatus Bathyarchaeota archaeon]
IVMCDDPSIKSWDAWLLNRTFGLPMSTARSYLYRLKKERVLIEEQDRTGDIVPGHYVRVRKPEETISDMISKTMRYKEEIPVGPDISTFKPELPSPVFDIRKMTVHNVLATLTKEHIEGRELQRCKIDREMVSPSFGILESFGKSEFESQKVAISLSDLLHPLNPNSLYRAWSGDLRENLIGESYGDTIKWGDHRDIVVTIYKTGSVNLQIASSKNPMSIIDIISIWGYLRALFPMRCGYQWAGGLAKYFELRRFEVNIDQGPTIDMVGGRNWANCITMEGWYGGLCREYLTTIGDEEALRREMVLEPNLPIEPFWENFIAMMTGGASYGYTVTSLHKLTQEVNSFILSVNKDRERMLKMIDTMNKTIVELKKRGD